METLVEQPSLETETQKSFDVLASVNLIRYDLDRFGYVKHETRERVCDQDLSLLAEGAGRASRTDFVLPRKEGQVAYFNEGEWQPYRSSLVRALRVHQKEAEKDPRRYFLVEWAIRDLEEESIVEDLKPGQRHVWYSAYPEEIEELHGADFTQSCGLKVARKMGFIYQAICQADGSIWLLSQTVDNSDEESFAAVIEAYRNDPDIDMDAMTRVYDGTLAKKHGRRYYAGRLEAEVDEEVWQIIKQQENLIEYHLNTLEQIASLSITHHQLEQTVKKHIYGVWGLFKQEIDRVAESRRRDLEWIPLAPQQIPHEVERAFWVLAKRGDVLVACGGSIGFNGLMEADPSDVFSSIFGRSERPESYRFTKKMYCLECQKPPKEKEPKKMCGPCGVCRQCDKKMGGWGV